MTYLNIFLIAVIMVNLIDLSGFIDEMERIIGRWLKCKVHIPKPFSCSYCSTHHICVLYLLIAGELTLYTYLFTLLMAYLTPVINNLLQLLRDGLNKIINWLYDALISE